MNNFISNKLCREIYAGNVEAGWWKDNRPDGTTIALIHSEVSESYRGFLTARQDDHLKHLLNDVVELGDTAIRIYDFFGRKEWDLEKAFREASELRALEHVHPSIEHVNVYKYYADMHLHISNALEGVRKNQTMQLGFGTMPVAAFELAIVMGMIASCVHWGWPLYRAIEEKRQYNAQRADHKLENRVKADGKKF
jgi:hypothetical protein